MTNETHARLFAGADCCCCWFLIATVTMLVYKCLYPVQFATQNTTLLDEAYFTNAQGPRQRISRSRYLFYLMPTFDIINIGPM